MRIERRELLKLTACACLTGAVPVSGAQEKQKKKRIPIGLQLYAVRGAFEADIPGTLKTIAKIGYKGVEFWGYGGGPTVFKGKTAGELRRMLDDVGLKCCGMHVQLKTLLGENLQKTVAINKTLGNTFLIVAAAPKEMGSVESIKRFAQTFNDLAVKAKKLGVRVGYHAHGFDFKRFDGRTGWDILFSNTKPEVVMQLDTGNCAGGGGDPVAILKKFPGRATTVHLKEYGAARFQRGNAIWQEIFRLCETMHRTQWYIVEQGGRGGKDLKIPQQCLEALHAMGK